MRTTTDGQTTRGTAPSRRGRRAPRVDARWFRVEAASCRVLSWNGTDGLRWLRSRLKHLTDRSNDQRPWIDRRASPRHRSHSSYRIVSRYRHERHVGEADPSEVPKPRLAFVSQRRFTHPTRGAGRMASRGRQPRHAAGPTAGGRGAGRTHRGVGAPASGPAAWSTPGGQFFGGGGGSVNDDLNGWRGGPSTSPTHSMFGLEEKVHITKRPPLQVRIGPDPRPSCLVRAHRPGALPRCERTRKTLTCTHLYEKAIMSIHVRRRRRSQPLPERRCPLGVSGSHLRARTIRTDASRRSFLRAPDGRRRAARSQVLCHMCGYLFGTSSLAVHQKTCAKKHRWGVEQYAPTPETPRGEVKECEARVAQCTPPPSGPRRPVPKTRGRAAEFAAYNEEAAELFRAHLGECLLCRSADEGRFEAAEAGPARSSDRGSDRTCDRLDRGGRAALTVRDVESPRQPMYARAR